MSLALPMFSANNDRVRRESERCCSIEKPGGKVVVEADAPITISPTFSKGRVFNLVPGFEAIPFSVALGAQDTQAEVRLWVERT
jgi:hypothetical protein